MGCKDVVSSKKRKSRGLLTEIQMFVGALSLQIPKEQSSFRVLHVAGNIMHIPFIEKSISMCVSSTKAEIGDSPSNSYFGIHKPHGGSSGVRDLWIVNPAGGEATVLFDVPWSGSSTGRLAWETDRRGGDDEARENDNKDER